MTTATEPVRVPTPAEGDHGHGQGIQEGRQEVLTPDRRLPRSDLRRVPDRLLAVIKKGWQ